MSQPSTSPLPLHQVKVVDFGQYIAGPAVAMILGDLGATVIHVDPPSGPLWDSPANATLNRNKLSITIDLKTPEGLQQAKALIAEADIVVESFRPGVMARLDLDFSELRKLRPELITLSIPGFASNDALRRDWRAFESVIAAASGVYTDMGLNRVLMGINPSFSPLPLASAYGTMLASSAVVLALQSREKTGLGDHIEVPLAAAVMEGLCYNSLKVDNYPERYKTQREAEIERRRAQGLPMDMSYEALQDLLDPFYRSYRCKDGRMFYLVCPSHKSHAKRCLQTLGVYDELVAQGLQEEEDTYLPVSEWKSDVSLGVYPMPKLWADRITKRLKEVFLTRTAKEWERISGKGKFPGAPQRWLQEWINDDHAETTGLMIEVEDPVIGKMIQPGPMVWLEESAEATLTPTPRQWVHFDTALTVLQAIKTQLPHAPEKTAQKGWLDGVRVLDLCNVIAGPHSVAYLARFGAKVIKIDPSKPFYDCWNTVIFGMSHMRAKQSVLTDIRHPAGRAVLEKLIANSDVVVWNATDDQVQDMGFDAESLAHINPDAIFCKLDCFGGVRPGTRTNYLGYDDLVQASTGIMLRFGGGMDTPEEHAHVGTIDVMCGFGAALGVAAALYQKYKTGRIGRPRTSLSALSGLAQIPFCYDHAHRKLFDEPAGRDVQGLDALTHLYQASTGKFLILSALESDVSKLDAVAGLKGLAQLAKADRLTFLQHAFTQATEDAWMQRLHAVDIGAALCDNIENIRTNSSRIADGLPGTANGSYAFSIFEDHPSGHVVTQLDPYAIRPSHATIYALAPAEKYGASTRQVLAELGYSSSEVQTLMDSGAVSDSWSKEYLPS